MGVDYSLSYIDPEGRPQFMYGVSDLGNDTVNTRFDVRNLTWEIDVKPTKGWISAGDVFFSMVIVLIISCFAGVLENVNSIVNGWKGDIVDKMAISIGCASHREFPEMTIEELGKTADKKMYEAKNEYYQNNHDRRRG